MIEKVIAYKASNGQTFEKIEDVQRFEIEKMLIDDAGPKTMQGQGGISNPPTPPTKAMDIQADVAAAVIVARKDRVIDILTTTARSKPKARAINGGRKNRFPKTPATAVDRAGNPAPEKA